jgi:hypothetical protein
MPNTYWYRFGGPRHVDVLWNTDATEHRVSIACGCREALVRYWNGHVLYPQDGMLTLMIDEQGAPMYVEYDPPARPAGSSSPKPATRCAARFEPTGRLTAGCRALATR